ncbi:SRPBCC family protein [Rhodovibrionaceae bacterium A322]
MQVFRSMIIDAPLEQVWATVRAFDGVAAWNPGVTSARMESGTATAVGSVRHLDIADGSVFRETLLAHSDLEHFYTYDIIDCPLPVSSYISSHRFLPVTHSNQTLSIWESRFDCAPEDATQMEEIVGDQIYIAAMTGLNSYLQDQG